MKKLTFVAAALAAAGVALFTSTSVLAQPAAPAALEEAAADPAAVDRAVERHLGSMLRQRLHDLREERAWAMGLR